MAALATMGYGQHRSFRIVTYNVENLFDTCHDAHYDDYEFLPSSPRRWNSIRYWKKQGVLARTLVAAGGPSPVEIVALCEVENDTVVRDLAERTKLARLGYRYLVTHSLDKRGIDVALLYQPDKFRLLADSSIRVASGYGDARPTRDIMHVSGRLPNADTLDIVVNHWPSRRGGGKWTLERRWQVGRTLRQYADSLKQCRRHFNLVMVGDFNDESSDRSIVDGLGAFPAGAKPYGYVVLSHRLKAQDGIRGTYKYKGRWNQLDQIIVSRSLLDSTSLVHTLSGACRILSFPFLLEKDETYGGVKPRRTYLGPIYKGGVSDHLPLILELQYDYAKSQTHF